MGGSVKNITKMYAGIECVCCPQYLVAYPYNTSIRQTIAQIQKYSEKMQCCIV
jgi:hypothetical protein